MPKLLSYSELPVLLKAPAVVTASFKSDILDTQGFDVQALEVMLGVGTGLDANNHITPVLEHSETTNDADFTVVDAENIVGGFTKVNSTSLDEKLQRAEYTATKRYLRVALTIVGTVSIPVSVRGCLASPQADFVLRPIEGLTAT